MKVRAFNKFSNEFFQSEVYAIINTEWYKKMLLIIPSENGDMIKFVDYLDKTLKPTEILINTIVSTYPSKWIHLKSKSVDDVLDDFKDIIDKNIRFFEFLGYSWIIENKELLTHLLNGNSVPLKDSVFSNRLICSNIKGWNYITCQKDADFLLKSAYGFHDSILKSLNYISGGYVMENKGMCPLNNVRTITGIIDSQLCSSMELVFEGVTALNLRPAGDNETAEIFDASVYCRNCAVFFSDTALDDIDKSYKGTWIEAYSLRWRFLE